MMLIPVVLLIIWKIKTRESLIPALVGAAAWLIFAIILKLAPAYFLMQADNPVSRVINQSVWLTYAVAGILAGVLEETGRLLSFKLALKKYGRRRTAVTYGIGHGGFESVYVGFQTASTAVLGIMVNAGLLGTLAAGMTEEQTASLASQLGSYASLSFGDCMLGVFERLPAIAVHIALSVLVFAAARKRRCAYLYPAAIVIHALFDFSVALYGAGLLPLWATELMLAVFALPVALFAALIYKKLGVKDENGGEADGAYLAGEIVSFDTVTLHTSGMRHVSEYEMVMKDGKAEVSEYGVRSSEGEKTRVLQRRAACSEKRALGLLNRCGVLSWDGFYGSHPKRVLDGTMFSLDASVNGGRKIRASGSQNFPRGYRDFTDGIRGILEEGEKNGASVTKN